MHDIPLNLLKPARVTQTPTPAQQQLLCIETSQHLTSLLVAPPHPTNRLSLGSAILGHYSMILNVHTYLVSPQKVACALTLQTGACTPATLHQSHGGLLEEMVGLLTTSALAAPTTTEKNSFILVGLRHVFIPFPSATALVEVEWKGLVFICHSL